jgi:endoglucanase
MLQGDDDVSRLPAVSVQPTPIRYGVCLAAFIALVAFTSNAGAAAGKEEFKVGPAINMAQWFTWPRYEATGAGISWPPYNESPRPPNAAELESLKHTGFETVRLPVDPAPFIVFKGERHEAVYKMLLDAIEHIQAAGLKVIVDLHPNSRHPVWGQNAIVAGLASPTFMVYSDLIEEMARRLSSFEASRVALELINEPRLKCNGSEQQLWQEMAGRLVRRARAGSPKLTFVITGSCVSSAEGLMALEPGPLSDANLIYTFHFYEPFTFTHQGAQFIPWPDKYLDEVPWPATIRPIEQPLALLTERIKTVTGLDNADRAKALSGAETKLRRFYASGAGSKIIENRFDEVQRWAEQHGIEPDRIFIGEFGVSRKQKDRPGARCEDRMRWLADVRSAAEKRGFTWAYFNYDGPFAIVADDDRRTLDAAVLTGLGLARGGQCEQRHSLGDP